MSVHPLFCADVHALHVAPGGGEQAIVQPFVASLKKLVGQSVAVQVLA